MVTNQKVDYQHVIQIQMKKTGASIGFEFDVIIEKENKFGFEENNKKKP
jgi:hypothetical protein